MQKKSYGTLSKGAIFFGQLCMPAYQLLLNAKPRSALKCVKSNATAEESATNVEKILQE